MLLLTNCFWTENDKMTQHFLWDLSAQRGALRVVNNVCVCHSFYSVTAQLQLWGRRQAPFNSDREAEGASRGEGSSHGFFFFYTLSHVLPAPCAAIAFSLLQCCWRHDRLPQPRPNMRHGWYQTALSMMENTARREEEQQTKAAIITEKTGFVFGTHVVCSRC